MDAQSSADASPTQARGTSTPTTAPTATGRPAPESRLLEVSVFDYTTGTLSKPEGTSIAVKGTTWKPDLSYGSAGPRSMGTFVVDQLHVDGLVVRPDGASGSTCSVDFQVHEGMVDESHEAITQVEIYNDEVWVYGQAIPGNATYDVPVACAR